jgi:hypothetical protein
MGSSPVLPTTKPGRLSGAPRPSAEDSVRVDSRHVGLLLPWPCRNQYESSSLIRPWVALADWEPADVSSPTSLKPCISLAGTGEFVAIPVWAFSSATRAPSLASSERNGSVPSPCGIPIFGTLWPGLTPTNSGTMRVETTGSDISDAGPARDIRLTGGLVICPRPEPSFCGCDELPRRGSLRWSRSMSTKARNYTGVGRGAARPAERWWTTTRLGRRVDPRRKSIAAVLWARRRRPGLFVAGHELGPQSGLPMASRRRAESELRPNATLTAFDFQASAML